MIHLDTSFLIRSLVVDSPEDGMLRGWLRAGETLAMSSIAWTEFLCGPVSAEAAEVAATLVTDRRAYEEADAAVAARLFNSTGRRRGSLVDCMIAAVALRAEAPVATSNPDDFRRFESAGLEVLTA